MSAVAGIEETVEFIDRCIAESDWDSLIAFAAPELADLDEASPEDLKAALDAVLELRSQIQERMDTVSAELSDIPTARKASRAYSAHQAS